MEFHIAPLIGANSIRFGMTPSDIQRIVKKDPEKFRRGKEINPSDFYVEDGFFCYYDDSEGLLEALEFASGCTVIIDGVDLFKLTFGAAVNSLRKIDPDIVVEGDSITSHLLSLGVWSPLAYEDENEPLESILVGRPGYYDFLKEEA